MAFTNGTFSSPVDGQSLTTYQWTQLPQAVSPRGVVQVSHGLAEHAGRYDRLAAALNQAGFLVAATDHRGHGRSIASAPGELGEAGFDGLISDVAAFGRHLAAEHPELPLILVAHSMGSFAAQSVLLTDSDLYSAVVLSGSTALDLLAGALAQAPAPVGLEAFNAGFEPRTGYEWLSRDESEVDLYVADPLCGFDLPATTVSSLFGRADELADPEALRRIRSDLPILIVSGSLDPVSGAGQLIPPLAQRYRDSGLLDVTVILYDEARHEIFNETNRDEVTADVIAWIDAHVGDGRQGRASS
jgi:alpha-beta hydrolase superfamily lysophospholipase